MFLRIIYVKDIGRTASKKYSRIASLKKKYGFEKRLFCKVHKIFDKKFLDFLIKCFF